MLVVSTDHEAALLAELLNGDKRTRPIVVVSTPAGRKEPWIDASEIESELADLADVYLIGTGPHSWKFSQGMPSGTQVYGGAGRAYPLGHGWVGNLHESPLRFAFDADEGARATQLLIDDALNMAAAAGLLETKAEVTRVRRKGVVKGIVADRALIDLDGHLAYVAPALAFHGVPLERVLAKGMNLNGWWNPKARWFDVRDARRDPVEALSEYAAGDVVLAVVHEVGPETAGLFLHPLIEVPIYRADVTSNALDDVRDLMSPGEVLPVRIAATGPQWRLSLIDIDDEEAPRTAISLLDDGPAWLLPPEVEQASYASPARAKVGLAPSEPAAEKLGVEESLAAIEESLAAAAPDLDAVAPLPSQDPSPNPSPLMLDPVRRSKSRPATTPEPAMPERRIAVETMSLTITKLKNQLARLREELDPMRDRLRGLEQEKAGLAAEVADLRRNVEHQDTLLLHARARLRKASRHTPGETRRPTFADPEKGFRHAVVTAWARRTPPSEQDARPLPNYAIGQRFLESVRTLEGIGAEKIADVVFEILTDRAKDLDGRELHALRTGESGNSPQRVREGDGATAWRVALQRNTPSARRIHYWRLPDGSIELSRVLLHDDMDP
jgi:hypothetical protein